MAKWFGIVGYVKQVETSPGIWEEEVINKNYYGDLIRNTRKLQAGSNMNDDINISNNISIVADPYAKENFHAIRYVEFMGTKWKVTDVEVAYPRLTMSLGGIYNG